MNDNAKCFIKIKKGQYEEITYKELKKRRKESIKYQNKRFIYIHKMLMEVTDKEYIEYYKEIEKNRYAGKVLRKLTAFSIDKIKEDEDFRDKETIEDKGANTENHIERKIELEQLNKALLLLTEDEYKIIKILFFEEKSLREYARDKKIPLTTLFDKKEKILEKLKKFMKI